MLHKFLEIVVGKMMFPLCGVKYYETDKIPAEGGCVLYSNHLSIWDPFLMHMAALPRIPKLMAKKELFDHKLLRKCVENLGAFPVDRGHGDIGAIRTACEVLNEGHIMGIYPEGTRSKTGEMGEFLLGAAMIASRADVPLVPMYISGKIRLFGKTRVIVGDPFKVSEIQEQQGLKSREAVRATTAVMREKLLELKGITGQL